MKICIYTLGCKVNQCESGGLYRALKERGYEVFEGLAPADVFIVNTCAVTAEAERKSRNVLTKIRKLSDHAKVIVIGCASENAAERFETKENVVYVSGVAGKVNVLNVIEDLKREVLPKEVCVAMELPLAYEDDFIFESMHTRAFIKVQDGCNNFCSYCLIPYLRGRSRSRSIESILNEIEVNKEAKEIVLTGINLSDYGRNTGSSLTALLLALSKVPARIRLGSLEVGVIDDAFLTAVKEIGVCPHFHLSLQSGSDRVLRAMNRKYTAEEYLSAVERIYRFFPDANITTDVIVGFPAEGEEEFCECVSHCEKVGFGDLHVFPFSKREGTNAAKMPDLSGEIKTERVSRLLSVREKLRDRFLAKFEGQCYTVLTEQLEGDFVTGYTENYIRVCLPKETPLGKLIRVKIGGRNKELDGVYGVEVQ